VSDRWEVEIYAQFADAFEAHCSQHKTSPLLEPDEIIQRRRDELAALIELAKDLKRIRSDKSDKLDPELLPYAADDGRQIIFFRELSRPPWTAFLHLDFPKCRAVRVLHADDRPQANMKVLLEKALEEMINHG
jgi:hypothetical protein